MVFHLTAFYTRIHLVSPLPLTLGSLGKRFITIPPSSWPGLYRGPIRDSQIFPTTVSGTWYPDALNVPSLAATVRKYGGIILHFHGGGYVIGSGRPFDSGHMAAVLTRHITPLALFAEYRLSCTPEGRFPAALQNAVSAYVFLLDQGVRPQDIVLSGDSAGGHLVAPLLRYISEYLNRDIPAFRCALLQPPWIDIAGAASADSVAGRRNYHTDYIPAVFADWAVASLAPTNVVDRYGPYITLLHKRFKTETKLWVHVGALEVLYDEVQEWVQQMTEVGCESCLRVEYGAPHDIIEGGHYNGFRKEGKRPRG